MSSFHRRTKNPETGEFENAWWLDDYFGRHRYGVQFSSGKVYREEEHKWEFDGPAPALASPAEPDAPEMRPIGLPAAMLALLDKAHRDGIAIGRAQVIAELAEPGEELLARCRAALQSTLPGPRPRTRLQYESARAALRAAAEYLKAKP